MAYDTTISATAESGDLFYYFFNNGRVFLALKIQHMDDNQVSLASFQSRDGWDEVLSPHVVAKTSCYFCLMSPYRATLYLPFEIE